MTNTDPPYKQGDRIHDLTAPLGGMYAREFEVVACLPIAPALAAASRASWQVIVLLPNGNYHNLYVDDTGTTPSKGFGPEPPERSIDELLAAYPEDAL